MISEKRTALLSINKKIISLLKDRTAFVAEIQSLKVKKIRFAHFDPKREVEVFKTMSSDLEGLTLKQLLIISLMVENDACCGSGDHYPEWSEGVHLGNRERQYYELINPILLKQFFPNHFKRLELTPYFQRIFQDLFTE